MMTLLLPYLVVSLLFIMVMINISFTFCGALDVFRIYSPFLMMFVSNSLLFSECLNAYISVTVRTFR